ncbi:MAG: malate synthase A, partial [Acidobacteriota bacterium]|nr:malate synthase A [Acidobacteriota bacterium]
MTEPFPFPGVEWQGPLGFREAGFGPGDAELLNPGALAFLADLVRAFRDPLEALLAARRDRQRRFDAGDRPHFLPPDHPARSGDWRVAPAPADLADRRVEITGPPEPKMLVNALNSGAKVYMADFEDSLSPRPENLLEGQAALHAAIRRRLCFQDAASGKVYAPKDRTAVLMVRPRGLHLPERHLLVDDRPVPACLFDAGLFLFHNARELVVRGTGPYLYLPKLEDAAEARWWNEVLLRAQAALGLPAGTVRVTMLIETLPAAFQMEAFLYELRQHATALNLGRWDYIFSFIKTLREDPAALLPDRSQVGMTQPFLRAYAKRLVQVCHRRGAHAMGGMSAFIPVKSDPAAHARAMAQVQADKLREVQDGCDGTWVAHPGLVAEAQAVFDAHLPGPNQLDRIPEGEIAEADLLRIPEGTRTVAGLRHNLRVGLRYLEAWLRGQGCVPLDHLMEDAATAEICRMQVWQWLQHEAVLEGGERLSPSLFHMWIQEALAQIRAEVGLEAFLDGRYGDAADLFETLLLDAEPVPFLTLPAYGRLLQS